MYYELLNKLNKKLEELQMAKISEKRINEDFRNLVTKEYIHESADNHVDCWKDRYYKKSLADIKLDLYSEHDISLEIERVEEDLKRKINSKEFDFVFNSFNKEVIRILKG